MIPLSGEIKGKSLKGNQEAGFAFSASVSLSSLLAVFGVVSLPSTNCPIPFTSTYLNSEPVILPFIVVLNIVA